MTFLGFGPSWLRPPRFPSDEENQRAGVLTLIVGAAIPSILLILGLRLLDAQRQLLVPLAAVEFLLVTCLALLSARRLMTASYLLCVTLAGFLFYMAATYDGVHDTSVLAFPAVLIIAALLLTRWQFVSVAALTLLAIFVLVWLDYAGIRHNRFSPFVAPYDGLDVILIIGITAVTARLLADTLLTNLGRARASEAHLTRQTQQLAESEIRYRSLFENAIDAILLIQDRAFVDCNQQALRLFGCTRDHLIGRTAADLSPAIQPDGTSSRERATALSDAALRGTVATFPWRYLRADGTAFDAEASLSRIDLGGTVVVQAIVRDVSDRAVAEAARRQSEARFRAVVEHNYDGILFFDRERMVLYASPSYQQLIGFDAGEITGRPGTLFVHPHDRAYTADVFQEALEHPGRVTTAEYRLRHRDGSWRTVESRLINLLDDPLVQAVVLNSRDITERKRADDALRESEARYRALFEHAIDGIFQSTLGGQALAANPAFVRMLGYASEQELVTTLVDLPRQLWAHPEERAHVAQLIARHGSVRGYECEFIRKDGNRILISLNATAVRGADGQASYFHGSIEDITDRKRAETERTRFEGQLQQAQRMESVGRLAGGVAHDFNNSLQLILLNAEMALGSPGVTPGSRRLLTDIQKTAQNAARLIAQLMAFARRQETHPQVLDLNAVTAPYLPMLRRLVGEDIAIAWEPGAGLGPVWLDPVQFEQVLINLATNARDAMRGNGHLTLATSAVTLGEAGETAPLDLPPGPYVRLAVSDDGCGMSEEVRGRIFEPFFTTKPVGEGTGLGLASVYGIVTQNGGSIAVDSAPGRGTTFTIQWPRHAVPTPLPPEAAPAAAFSRGHETLLVVEDEAMLLRACTACLRPLGYTVLAATLPSEALRAAAEHDGPIHLLVTDVIMPEMNGRELADRLSETRPGLRRLFMSGHAAGVLSERGLADGNLRLIHKPFALEDLAGAVRAALDET